MYNKTTKYRHNVSLRSKLSIYFALIISVLIIVVLSSNIYVSHIFNRYINMQNLSLQLSDFFDEINNAKSAYIYYFSAKSDADLQRYLTAIESSRNILNNLNDVSDDEDTQFHYGLLMNMVNTYDEKATEMIDLVQSSDSVNAFVKMQEANYLNSLINLQFEPYFTLQLNSLYEDIILMEFEIEQFKFWNAFLIIVGIIICFVLIISFTRNITKPIMILANSAKKISANDFEIEPVKINTGDEISLLANAFNDMVKSINYSIAELEKSAKIKEKLLYEENVNLKMSHILKESQLKMLQDKINPHFLFNTLNLLYQTAYMEEADKTMEMLYYTSKLLRYGLNEMNRPITIRQELEAIRCYIYIQEQRYGDRIQFKMDDSGIVSHLDFCMPALILQPIVENAVSHGLSLKKEGGEINIRCNCQEGELVIEVSDNGCGIPEETIQRILLGDYMENDGIGIRNVVQRLELFYSRSDCIYISSELNKGTKICLFLPIT